MENLDAIRSLLDIWFHCAGVWATCTLFDMGIAWIVWSVRKRGKSKKAAP